MRPGVSLNGTEILLLPSPREFRLAALIEIDLFFAIFVNVHEVFDLRMRQVFPPPETFVSISLALPVFTGREIETLTLTKPFLALETATLVIAGDEGFDSPAFAGPLKIHEATMEIQIPAAMCKRIICRNLLS